MNYHKEAGLHDWTQGKILKSPERTITLSEHAAQLQAACVELRDSILKVAQQVQCDSVEAFGILAAVQMYNRVKQIPIPTAALETAIAEARYKEAEWWRINLQEGPEELHFWSALLEHIAELQAALDAAKAKESK